MLKGFKYVALAIGMILVLGLGFVIGFFMGVLSVAPIHTINVIYTI